MYTDYIYFNRFVIKDRGEKIYTCDVKKVEKIGCVFFNRKGRNERDTIEGDKKDERFCKKVRKIIIDNSRKKVI